MLKYPDINDYSNYAYQIRKFYVLLIYTLLNFLCDLIFYFCIDIFSLKDISNFYFYLLKKPKLIKVE